jgi:hypothetical protein
VRYIKVLGLFAIVILAGTFEAKAQNWQIVPGQSVGPIGRSTSEKELINIFGATNVKQADIDVGEGETQPGTILFPNDPRKKAFILWRDATTRLQPESVTIRGKNTFWKTDRGVTLGTPLKTIEELNGRAFVMTGFGWDYSGTVLHSNGGRMVELGIAAGEEIKNRTLLLRLEPATALLKTPEYNAVLGDVNYFSDNPALRKLNPRVYEMVVDFPL